MEKSISRREFLKLSGAAAGAALIPHKLGIIIEGEAGENGWPRVNIEALPQGEIKEVLALIPEVKVNRGGLLTLKSTSLPLAETDWSRLHRYPIDPDALTVHWDGHDTPAEVTVKNVLNGYNQVRTSREGDYEFVTSAHATIGPHPPGTTSSDENSLISILQTQVPQGGFPTVSSHLRSNLSREREAYVNARHPVNSLQLASQFYGLDRDYSYISQALSGIPQDLNLRTISLELVGKDFDREESRPNPQLTANATGVILAFMKRHPQIPFANITGHNEIQIDKADPGKSYLAELRLILALKVLAGNDRRLKNNLFEPFLGETGNKTEAVKRFFDFHWDRLVASYWGHPKEVSKWETTTNYWNIYRNLFNINSPALADAFVLPVLPNGEQHIVYGNSYGTPDYHEGVDLNIQTARQLLNEDLGEEIYAAGNGHVIFASQIPGLPGLGKTLVLEHILPDGRKILSLYAHLDNFKVNKGQAIDMTQQIATMGNSGGQADAHLHFAIFPAATKRERELNYYLQLKYSGVKVNPYSEDETGRVFVVPQTANQSFVESYYFEPLSFITENS